MKIQNIKLALLVPSKTNPRKEMEPGALAELAESLKTVGLLEPVTVRAKGEKYEVVFGHRRHKAAELAELADIPCIVREMTDVEVIEAQLVENLQREDLTEIEEADGYVAMQKVCKYDVPTIAARIGKSKGYVYARMKLLELPAAAAKALRTGDIDASTALLIARLPHKSLMEEATKRILARPYADSQAMSYRQAKALLEEQFTLQLAKAPFKTEDANLVKKAGVCSACPKRSGNARDLFPDIKSDDVCTDPVCFAEKKEAAWSLRAVEAKAEGATVLPDKTAKALFQYESDHLNYNSGYVKLSDTVYDDPKRRTWSTLLGKDHGLTIALARDSEGRVHKLVKALDAQKVLVAAGHKFWTKKVASPKKKDPKTILRERVEAGLDRAVIEALVGKVEGREPKDTTWRLLAKLTVKRAWHDSVKAACKRRGLEAVKSGSYGQMSFDKPLGDLIDKMNGAQARGLIVELLFSYASMGVEGEASLAKQTCEHFGVDLSAVRKKVTDKVRADLAAKATKKVAKPEPKKAVAKVAKKKVA